MAVTFIGIDPGNHNGMAVYNTRTKKLFVDTFGFWETIAEIIGLKKHCLANGDELKVIIECPQLNKGVFRSKLTKVGNMDMKIAESVGMNKQTAIILVDFCKKKHIDFIEIRPTKTKKTSDEFKAITGISRSSQHERDAAMLLIYQKCTHYAVK